MDSTWRRNNDDSLISDDGSSENEGILSSDNDSSPSKFVQVKRNTKGHKSKAKKKQKDLFGSESDDSDSEKPENEDRNESFESAESEPETAGAFSDSPKTSPDKNIYKGRLPHPEQLRKEEKAEEDIIISSDEAESSTKNDSGLGAVSPSSKPHNLSDERKTELKNAKKFYEIELQKEMASLQSLKATIKTVKVESLPDKGAKLRTSIEKQVEKVKKLNQHINHISSNIETDNSNKGPIEISKQDLNIPSIVDLTKDNTDLTEMGKRALATHQAHQSQTVQTLERLHKFLRKSVDEKEIEEPRALKVPLLPHQKVALNWLLLREKERPAGGILADDMGLGKTLTIIALILKDRELNVKETESSNEEDDENTAVYKTYPRGKTLVVCPSSVMGQWSSEINSKVKGGHLSVYLHHGTKKETRPRGLANFDVVLTTYTILRIENGASKSNPLLNVRWKRVVLDEAHTVRNYKSQTAQAVFALRAQKRWALTGTPIHNRQEDYFSLLKFLRCKPFDDIVVWKKMVGNRGEAGMQRLHLITKSLLLRRTKEEIQAGGGLQSLKPKSYNTIEIKLDPEEWKVYTKISHFSRTLLAHYIEQRAEKEDLLKNGLNIKRNGLSNPFADHPELGKLYNDMLMFKGGVKSHHILELLLRLRQVCCHPSLVTALIDKQDLGDALEDDAGNDVDLLEQMMNLSLASGGNSGGQQSNVLSSDDPVFKTDRCSSKMRAAIDCLTEILKSDTDKAIIVSQWTSVLDLMNRFLRQIGVRTVSLNGSVPVKDRIGIIEDFNNKSHGPKVLLLSLTAGGTGLNLVGANHLLLFDIHWNPQLEAQACDRIYRVGQTKAVQIYKFLCKDTIEEKILKLQKHKLELANSVLSGSSKYQSTKLSMHDLKLLFDIK